jgi:hypothetical protein
MIWWLKNIALVILSCFFLLFGIMVLISAYKLNNPFDFIMSFFSSNLIILISAALLFGFLYRMYRRLRNIDTSDEENG